MRYTHYVSNDEHYLAEMLTYVPLCTHSSASSVLLLDKPASFIVDKTLCSRIDAIQTDDIAHHQTPENGYDIVISFACAPVDVLSKLVSPNGILCIKATSDIQGTLKSLDSFRIVMPYHDLELIFASNRFHPLADIVLHKSDLIENVEYYSTEIHIGSFALTPTIKKMLSGLIKA